MKLKKSQKKLHYYGVPQIILVSHATTRPEVIKPEIRQAIKEAQKRLTTMKGKL